MSAPTPNDLCLAAYLVGMDPKQQAEAAEAIRAHVESENASTLPIIRSAIMLLVEIQLLYVPKEGHFNAQINARIESLKKRLPAT